MRTTDIGLSSTYKTVWWTVDLGANYSIYSISIDFKDYKEFGDYEMRQRGRFAGFSLYLSYTPNIKDDVLCYKNTLPLPPLKFNTTCIGYGRYVIYYNERLDGVSYPEGYQTLNLYTELCEVTVQGCVEEGFYGSNCSIHCPINCQNQRCNIVNGACLGCFPGYVGEMCEGECAWGFYGMECKKKCGHCKRNTSCNHVTGNCDRGCAAGWIGKQCNQRNYKRSSLTKKRMDFVNSVVASDILEISVRMSVRKAIMVKTVLTFVQQNAVIHVTMYREPALKMKRQQDNGN
ncbi:multiple epidermal growth factor-like domains protein 6 [Saccostrea echinata]|uniref:multiple epidermal growth factor-like domains protein 6 n=1 Tax=Saccostrea echinata TaxID=191078 RepID=UPI002A82E582|nr:multiple epidermal growth factor-like domains protein 6 [Saccostrea echinata]